MKNLKTKLNDESTTEVKNLKELKTMKTNKLIDSSGFMEEIMEELSHFSLEGQNLEKDFAFFVREEETEEDRLLREENQKNYRLAYGKEAQLFNKRDENNMPIKSEFDSLSEELKQLIAEQDMDDKDFGWKVNGKHETPVKVTIQKYYEMEAFSEETMQDETISGWFNLTSKDLGLGHTHKQTAKDEDGNEYEYRAAHRFEVDESIISKDDNGNYQIDAMKILEELDFNFVYSAGDYTDLIMINGYEYRIQIEHPLLAEIVDVDYCPGKQRTLVGYDGHSSKEEAEEEGVEYKPASIILVQPKEMFTRITDRYQENQKDSNDEIMYGRAADVIKGTTQLFMSEWQERMAQMREEKQLEDISLKAKVTKTAARIRAVSSPFYSIVMEMNSLYEEGKTRELAQLALAQKDNADAILDYARANRQHASLISDRDVIGLTPYMAVRKYRTKAAKKVQNKADLIDEKTRALVLKLKRTMDMDLITEENAKDVIQAARAGGEFRMDGDYKVLYMHAREVARSLEEAPVENRKASAASA